MVLYIIIHGLLCIGILALTYFGARYVRSYLDQAFSHLPHQFTFFKHFIIGGFYFLGVLIAISTVPVLQHTAHTLLVSSGIFAVIVGVASQEVFSNIICGIYLIVTQPIAINDHVKIGEAEGIVQDITLRYTVLYDKKNNLKSLVPNKYVISQVITKF